MSSTLPRTRSLSSGTGTSASSYSLSGGSKDKVRPVSLCEASWGRVIPQHYAARTLQRSPSQANNLSTTVPCSLVTKNLGGRHHPTRSSLKHSRMVVRSKKAAQAVNRRWSGSGAHRGGSGLGRAGSLVMAAQMLVGVLMAALAGWCLIWAPRSIAFREVPHYPALPLFLSGALGGLLLLCCRRRREKASANVIKALIALLSSMAIVTCLCVSVFAALHLVYLAPMRCREIREVVQHRTTQPSIVVPTSPYFDSVEETIASTTASPSLDLNRSDYDSPTVEPTTTTTTAVDIDIDVTSNLENSTTSTSTMAPTTVILDDWEDSSGDGELLSKETGKFNRFKRDQTHADEEIDGEEEGSGSELGPEIHEDKFLNSMTGSSLPMPNEAAAIHIEVIYCVCESRSDHWKRIFRYPDLRCLEVNRVLPVLSVATCIVTGGGAILSGVVLYLLWSSKESFYDPVRPSEIRPIIFSSNLKRNNSMQSKINDVAHWNGNGVACRNGDSRYYEP